MIRTIALALILLWCGQDTKVQELRIPYKVTDANHIMIRCKVNDKGPFNFIVDTGAPALFLTTAVAKEIGIEADKDKWGKAAKLEIEGGALLKDVRARIEDPFQLQGMASMGIKLHGIVGYNILARYKMDILLTRRYMIWTPLDYNPPDPPDSKELFGDQKPDTTQQKQMEQLAKLMAQFMGNANQTVEPRGWLGFEVENLDGDVVVSAVYEKCPADVAGLKKGDVITSFKGKSVTGVAALLKAAVAVGEDVVVKVKRGDEEKEITMKAEKGL
jgi:hypothetical protein